MEEVLESSYLVYSLDPRPFPDATTCPEYSVVVDYLLVLPKSFELNANLIVDVPRIESAKFS